jgi:hypothetical protein
MSKIALCVFALGTVAGLAVASLCVPMVYGGEVGQFGVCVGTAAASAVCLVLNLEGLARRPATARPRA